MYSSMPSLLANQMHQGSRETTERGSLQVHLHVFFSLSLSLSFYFLLNLLTAFSSHWMGECQPVKIQHAK